MDLEKEIERLKDINEHEQNPMMRTLRGAKIYDLMTEIKEIRKANKWHKSK